MAEKHRDRTERTRRVVCLILVILMVLGCASYTVMFLIAGAVSASAADNNPLMSIGIAYGDSAASSFRTYSDSGHLVLAQNPDGARESLAIWELSDKTLITVPHKELNSFSGMSFAGNRVELSSKFSSISDAKAMMSRLSGVCSQNGWYTIPAYIDGYFRVRVGTFRTYSAAESAAATIRSSVGEDAYALTISDTEVSILSEDGSTKFEFDGRGATNVGLTPLGSSYIRTDAGYNYRGSLMLRRDGSVLTVINILELEAYIEGVLPYEISSSWPAESQKAFAIAARSYAIGNRGKHYKSYGFDLCCTTNCQVYHGHGSVNDAVRSAVAATAGQVLSYNGRAVSLFYSSSTGGCTVSAEDCWGGTGAPYLTAVQTPWERYTEYSNGVWATEVTPAELCTYLRNKGYTTLSGEISNVSVTSLAKDSSYVKSITFTDTYGNSVTVTNTDKVRTTLGAYVKSANFTVARGKNNYVVQIVTPNTERIPYNSFNPGSFNLMTASGQISSGGAAARVISGSGMSDLSCSAYIITADGGSSDVVNGYKVSYEDRSYTASSSRKRTSSLAGCTFTSTISQGSSSISTQLGNFPTIIAPRYPSSSATPQVRVRV